VFVSKSQDFARDVTSHKEIRERNGNSHSYNSIKVTGMGREPNFFRIPSESEKVFARIFFEWLRSSGLPKTSTFQMDNSDYLDLDPSPCILILRIILLLHQKVSMMVIVNIDVYKRNI